MKVVLTGTVAKQSKVNDTHTQNCKANLGFNLLVLIPGVLGLLDVLRFLRLWMTHHGMIGYSGISSLLDVLL